MRTKKKTGSQPATIDGGSGTVVNDQIKDLGTSVQMSIFGGLMDIQDKSEIKEISNILHIYSLIPKMVNRQASVNGIVSRIFPLDFGNMDASSIEVEIREAKIKVYAKDGSYKVKSAFPGIREERIEEALIYIASLGGNNVSVDPSTGTVGVYFVINHLKDVIYDLFKKDEKWIDVKAGLELLNLSNLAIKPAKGSNVDSRFNISSTRLKSLIWAKTGSDGSNDGATRCWVEFHPLLAVDIQNKAFHLYAIAEKRNLKKPLSHVLFDRLSVYYRHASVENTYHFDGRKFMESSYLGFNEKHPRKSWSTLRQTIDEMKEQKILGEVNETLVFCPLSTRNKIVNIIFVISVTEAFQKRVMAVNGINKKLSQKIMNKRS